MMLIMTVMMVMVMSPRGVVVRAAMSERCETTDLLANLLIYGCIHTWQNGLRLCICEEAGERDS